MKVLLQGGLYGTIVSYDAEDLDAPALIEIAPGTVIEVHSQAILRIVEPTVVAEDEGVAVDELDAPAPLTETPEETRARLERDADDNK